MTLSVDYWWNVTDMGELKINLSHCHFEWHIGLKSGLNDDR